jgi:hypothetical protein
MHNILTRKLDKIIINVRTIPSDPRCDVNSNFNFITGVGYKHLGLIQYILADQTVPKSQFEMGILYYLHNEEHVKLRNEDEIKEAFYSSEVPFDNNNDLIFVLWEESGGHTFNILNISQEKGEIKLTSEKPLIGDKYPAPAMLVLCTLVNMGYNLTNFLDASLFSGRRYVSANDDEKLKYMRYFSEKLGQKILAGGKFEYKIGGFSDMMDNFKTIHLSSQSSDLYIRPSGTGPNIKIYIYGPKESYLEEMEVVEEFIKKIQI